MINLLNAITDLEKQKGALTDRYNAEVKELDDAIAVLRKSNQACWCCGGRGWNLRQRVCAEDDRPNEDDPRDRRTCRMCHGTGIKHWDGDFGEMTIDPKSGETVLTGRPCAEVESHAYLAAHK